VPIPIKLPGDKSDISPSAPDEPKHIYCWRKSTLIDHNQSATTTIDNETVATDVTAAESVATDQSNNQHDNSVDDIFAEVVEFVEGHDCMPIGDEAFDEIVWEMALAVKDTPKTKTKRYQRNRRPPIRYQSKHSLTNEVMKAISVMSFF
jgi:hypothetical protein